MPLMRARHDVFGVADVPDNDFYRRNGWTKVDAGTPTAEEERRREVNAARRSAPAPAPASEPPTPGGPVFDPDEHNADDVVAYLASAGPEERQRVLELERSGKARKTVLDED